MTIEEIKSNLRKKATIFYTGGFRPSNEKLESWIGKVGWQKSGEQQPLDENNNKMIPLATIFLDGLQYVPDVLNGVKLITVYVSINVLDNLIDKNLAKFFNIRLYKNIDDIEKCEYTSEQMLAFPLKPQLVENDYPMWEDLEDDMLKEILDKENNEGIDYYNDIADGNSNYSIHKIGGYPSVIQGRVSFSEGYEFAMQITSDGKAGFNIVDSGNFYFGYNPDKNDWEVYCDFY